jgi:Spy/CpxP family protein refolding chaperone
MRRINSVLLALTLVWASAAGAQQRMAEGRGGPLAPLLRGIELTADQKQRIQAIVEQHRPAGPPEGMRGGRGGPGRGDTLGVGRQGRRGGPPGDSTFRRRPGMGDSTQAGRRPGRPDGGPMRGDTAEMRGRREQMEAQRVEMIAQVRTVLTSAQRQQFDLNVQEMAQRRQGGPGRSGRVLRPESNVLRRGR